MIHAPSGVTVDNLGLRSYFWYSYLKPFYSRLNKLDVTLPTQFVTNDPRGEYIAALLKVQNDQRRELVFLYKEHPAILFNHYNEGALRGLGHLEKLEAIHVILNKISHELHSLHQCFYYDDKELNKLHALNYEPKIGKGGILNCYEHSLTLNSQKNNEFRFIMYSHLLKIPQSLVNRLSMIDFKDSQMRTTIHKRS